MSGAKLYYTLQLLLQLKKRKTPDQNRANRIHGMEIIDKRETNQNKLFCSLYDYT